MYSRRETRSADRMVAAYTAWDDSAAEFIESSRIRSSLTPSDRMVTSYGRLTNNTRHNSQVTSFTNFSTDMKRMLSPKPTDMPNIHSSRHKGRPRTAVPTRAALSFLTRSRLERKKRLSSHTVIEAETPYEKLVRVAKIVRIVAACCLSLKRYISRGSTKEWSLVEMQLNLQQDFNKLLAFNVQSFAHKDEHAMAGEKLKAILMLPPEDRTMEHIQVIFALLRGNNSFEDYPYHTKILLCRCMIYQSYERRRIIIKQGHPPASFYIILSGTVLINVKETDPRSSEVFVRTVHQMSGGEAFGEIALIKGENRTSTVVCKTDVELLVIMKEDFDVIIKEPLEKQREQHINYCKSHDLFRYFPCDIFILALNQFFYQYFKKDMVVVENSKESNYLILVKSGKCKVICDFQEPAEKKRSEIARTKSSKEREMENIFPLFVHHKRLHDEKDKTDPHFEADTDELREVMKANLMTGAIDQSRVQDARADTMATNVAQQDDFWKNRMVGETKDIVEKEAIKMSIQKTWKKATMAAVIYQEKLKREAKKRQEMKTSYAQIAELGAGAVFGLETMFQKSPVNLSLISEGAECILISKKLFLQEANSKVLRVVSDLVMSYPSAEYVKQQVHQQRAWYKYKKTTVSDILSRSHKIQSQKPINKASSANVIQKKSTSSTNMTSHKDTVPSNNSKSLSKTHHYRINGRIS